MFAYKCKYSPLCRIISAVLIAAFFPSDVAWAGPLSPERGYSLARWTASEDCLVARGYFATMYRESDRVWGIPRGTRDYEELGELCLRGFTLPSEIFAVPHKLIEEANPQNDLLLARICSHEEFRALMRKREEVMLRAKRPRSTKYYGLRERFLNDEAILRAYYNQLSPKRKALIARGSSGEPLLDPLLNATITRFEIEDKEKRTKEDRAKSVLFHDIVACAFELLFIINGHLVYPSRLKSEERAFIGLMRSVLREKDSRGRPNFPPVFFNAQKRIKAAYGSREDKGKWSCGAAEAVSAAEDKLIEKLRPEKYECRRNYDRPAEYNLRKLVCRGGRKARKRDIIFLAKITRIGQNNTHTHRHGEKHLAGRSQPYLWFEQ